MKILWCWRCKMDIPMMDDDEWDLVWRVHRAEMDLHRDGRPAALAEYQRLTGFKETNFNALFHHLVSKQGPSCPRCGRVLRTPVAYKCFECGLQVHEPNWSYLFRLEVDAFAIKGGGIVVVANEPSIVGRLLPGGVTEFRDNNRVVGRATLLSVERFHGPPPENKNIGLLLESDVPCTHIKQGQDAWLVQAAKPDLNSSL